MNNTQLSEQHSEKQPIEFLFESLLAILKELDLAQESPRIFLVYAHDKMADVENIHDNDANHKQANAQNARQLIQWLRELNANIYSDRTAVGNSNFIVQTPTHTANILSSQLRLLPELTTDAFDHVILCGSELLGHYLSSSYYKQYYEALKNAYHSDQQTNTSEISAITACVNSHVQDEDFHHALTELAFLSIRADNRAQEDHGILPILLNGTPETSLPEFITRSSTIRIEDPRWYAHPQGLHKSFFKLLKRCWVKQERIIQVLEENVYNACTPEALQRSSVSESFKLRIETACVQALEAWRRESTSTLRTLNIAKIMEDIFQKHMAEPPVDTNMLREALNKAMSERLTIQRISDELLPMAQCYINLSIIEHQHAQEENQETTEDKPREILHRLSSFEAIDRTNTQKLIPLAELFKPRKLQNGTTRVPQRILIQGRAGVGKTTLSKKSVYDYIHGTLWHDQFDWVLWIPLRKLKGKPESYSLETFFYAEYFSQQLKADGEDLAQALYQQMQKTPEKTLLILDGWDEIAQEAPSACLRKLLNHPAIIITSRPYGVNRSQLSQLDLELETIGFSHENVTAYLDAPDIVPPSKAREIKRFIQNHPFVRDLVNIPIQLDALCYSWDVIKHENRAVHTMTALYQAMIHKLWHKDIYRLARQANGRPLTEAEIQAIRDPERLERLVPTESDCLSALALNGLYRNQIEFSPNELDAVIKQLEAQNGPLSFTLEQDLKQLSCLHVEKEANAAYLLSFHFLHLTFQEFFAAKWLVKHMLGNTPLGLLDAPELEPVQFIQQHKYNPRYEIVWWFMAGLLPAEALASFFVILEDPSIQDLIGIQHQRLIMHCLQESRDQLSRDVQKSLEANLKAWLQFEISQITIHDEPSTLGRQSAFPESFLLAYFQEQQVSGGIHLRRIAGTLGARPSLSKVVAKYLLELTKDSDKKLRKAVAEALGSHAAILPEAMACLLELAKESNKYVKSVVAKALGQHAAILPEAKACLLELAKDLHKDVRWGVAKALGPHAVILPEVKACLLELSKDSDASVRWGVASALGPHAAVLPEAMACLLELAKDPHKDVRWGIAEALGPHAAILPEAKACLLELAKDLHKDVRWGVAAALGPHAAVLPEAIACLLELAKDSHKDVRWGVARALGPHAAILPEAKACLLELAKHSSWDVKSTVTEALGPHAAVLPEAMACLLELAKDPHKDVRWGIAEALGPHAAILPEAKACLLELAKDLHKDVRWGVAKALGPHAVVLPEVIACLFGLMKDQSQSVRRTTAQALAKQPVWRLLSTATPSLCKDLYTRALIQKSFQQIAPLYLENNTLYFYHAMQREEITFTETAGMTFRQAIRKEQGKIGIPLASRVKLSHNVALVQNEVASNTHQGNLGKRKRNTPAFA